VVVSVDAKYRSSLTLCWLLASTTTNNDFASLEHTQNLLGKTRRLALTDSGDQVKVGERVFVGGLGVGTDR
jgi:hypothetical protein